MGHDPEAGDGVLAQEAAGGRVVPAGVEVGEVATLVVLVAGEGAGVEPGPALLVRDVAEGVGVVSGPTPGSDRRYSETLPGTPVAKSFRWGNLFVPHCTNILVFVLPHEKVLEPGGH